ncbi:hypothetical protein AB0M80_41540 [Amycolatopsis sp. NPDC051045]|uniref:ATP dependent DNA ligase n=1 Tax=Amycolatopsis sp. NPDC051045 TaxID=3156922 RepID=UPI0034172DC5
MEALEQRRHPFAVTPPLEDTARAHWVRPELVGDLVFRQFTHGVGRLRHTAWRGLREDANLLTSWPRAPVNASTPKLRRLPICGRLSGRLSQTRPRRYRWGRR